MRAAEHNPRAPGRTTRRGRALAIIAYASVAGCLVGPAYHPPPPPTPKATGYKEAGTWKLARPGDAIPRGRWWTIFGEPELDALQAQLNISNQSIAIAVANYVAARAQIRSARAVLPDGDRRAGGGVGALGRRDRHRARNKGGGNVGRFNAYVLPADVSWAPDLFGRVRSAVRQRQYSAQAIAADLESTRLLAQAQLTETYFLLRGQDALQELLDATVVANQQIVDVIRERFDRGIENGSVVVRPSSSSKRLACPSHERRHPARPLRALDRDAARRPGDRLRACQARRPPAKPPSIPLSTPSQLLERRPDIASAERKMAAANATIGIGYAAYFPVLSLSGTGGFASEALRSLFDWPHRIWAIGSTLSQTIFDGGQRRAIIDQAVAEYNATVASYRLTVLAAFQQVEDLLSQLRVLELALEQQRKATDLAQRAFDFERQRYQAGLDRYTDLMLQQTALLGARQLLVALQVQQMSSAVELVQALGGGWDRSQLPPP